MIRRYILAIDPGKRTGFAFLDRFDLLPVAVTEPGDSFWSEQYDFIAACRLIDAYTAALGDQLDVVAEPYKITQLQAPWSLEMIGVARYLSQEQTKQDLITKYGRSPGFCTDDRLHALGWYKTGKRDANSAARQLLAHLVFAGKWWDDRLGPKTLEEVDSFRD